ncbi:endonuclease MutS2, partial [Xanthovirga aplysinae]|uniref:endonuclease MutS2 n=1 Tax=Xanthovirga aplysinae TaxID=2529853 RepID=UPI0012BCC752
MLYPKNIEKKIGFDKVRQLVKEECVSPLGITFVEKMRFSDAFPIIEKLCRQTEEFRQILLSQDPFPASGYLDVNKSLEKARIEGAFLDEDEFHQLKQSLQTIFKCLSFFDKDERSKAYPLLKELGGMVHLDKNILNAIEGKIDEKGKLRNNASNELQQIRQKLLSEQRRLRIVLDRILRDAQGKGFTPDDISLTIRSGRMVIPVLAEHKRKIKGFIHDESATGQTVYLEPTEVLEINNEIRDLEYREKREIIRILTELTNQLRPNLPFLKKAYQFLGLIDFIRAKAKFALKIDGSLPHLEKTQLIDWHHAKHPLLFLSHQAQGKPVVPLNITLNHQQRIVLISGPNAGGKSVTLKTVALLQYMLQSGLLIPVHEHSKAGVFKHLFIDIGDEQSIENDLSTYSSHLTNMKYFYNFADKKTLFFIDEFGTGTEPQFGGALAEAMLNDLNKKKTFGVITTHYANLKKFADKTQGLSNASMRFDLDKLESMYELEIGKAGSSYALEIARKIGLPHEIIKNAKGKVGSDHVSYDKLLGQLERERKKYADLNKNISRKDNELEKSVKEYQELKEYLEMERRKVLNKAKTEAKHLLKEANREIENTIREIREKKAEKEQTKKIRENLEKLEKSVKTEHIPESREEIKVIEGEIHLGDLVRIKGQETVGEIVNLKGKDAEITIGQLTSKVKLNRLERISRKTYRKVVQEVEKPAAMKGYNVNHKMSEFSTNLDLRGKRAEEALGIL